MGYQVDVKAVNNDGNIVDQNERHYYFNFGLDTQWCDKSRRIGQ